MTRSSFGLALLLAAILTASVLLLAREALPVTAPLVERIKGLRAQTDRARDVRCLSPLERVYVPAYRVPLENRRANIVKEKNRLARARAADKQCLPTDPIGIIRYVFPDATEDAAIRVVDCETGGTFWPGARNASSGASGLFQLMPFHWQGRFDPFDPWANSRYALRLSQGGWDWGPWVCKP